MTNFEKIKQMSAEEFAEFMLGGSEHLVNDLCRENAPEGFCQGCKYYDELYCRKLIAEEWLKTEVKK